MPIYKVDWEDGTGQEISVSYDDTSQNQILSLVSPASENTQFRKKAIRLRSLDGELSATIEVGQAGVLKLIENGTWNYVWDDETSLPIRSRTLTYYTQLVYEDGSLGERDVYDTGEEHEYGFVRYEFHDWDYSDVNLVLSTRKRLTEEVWVFDDDEWAGNESWVYDDAENMIDSPVYDYATQIRYPSVIHQWLDGTQYRYTSPDGDAVSLSLQRTDNQNSLVPPTGCDLDVNELVLFRLYDRTNDCYLSLGRVVDVVVSNYTNNPSAITLIDNTIFRFENFGTTVTNGGVLTVITGSYKIDISSTDQVIDSRGNTFISSNGYYHAIRYAENKIIVTAPLQLKAAIINWKNPYNTHAESGWHRLLSSGDKLIVCCYDLVWHFEPYLERLTAENVKYGSGAIPDAASISSLQSHIHANATLQADDTSTVNNVRIDLYANDIHADAEINNTDITKEKIILLWFSLDDKGIYNFDSLYIELHTIQLAPSIIAERAALVPIELNPAKSIQYEIRPIPLVLHTNNQYYYSGLVADFMYIPDSTTYGSISTNEVVNTLTGAVTNTTYVKTQDRVVGVVRKDYITITSTAESINSNCNLIVSNTGNSSRSVSLLARGNSTTQPFVTIIALTTATGNTIKPAVLSLGYVPDFIANPDELD